MKTYRTIVSFKCDICGNVAPSVEVEGDCCFLPARWIEGEEPGTHICRGCVEFFGPYISRGKIDPCRLESIQNIILDTALTDENDPSKYRRRRIEYLKKMNKESEQE